jgi:hypothetical protein
MQTATAQDIRSAPAVLGGGVADVGERSGQWQLLQRPYSSCQRCIIRSAAGLAKAKLLVCLSKWSKVRRGILDLFLSALYLYRMIA